MLPESLKLILHSYLEDNEIIEVGWSFKYLTDDNKDKARDIYCLEVRIDGLRDDDLLDEQAVKTLHRIARKLCDGRLGAAYLVFFEHTQLPKSRLRSYKGVFPYKGQIKQGEYIEFEFELEAGLAFFAGMTPITKDNRDECFPLAGSFWQGFIVLSGIQTTNIYSREFLESIIPCLDTYTRGGISINSLKLIPMACSQGLIVFSFGSDGSEDHRNISLFFNREIKSLVQRATDDAVSEAARPDIVY
jgi:hypothetical protein